MPRPGQRERHLQRHRLAVCTPRRDPAVPALPLLDFSSGYVQRALPTLPKQGDRAPWQLHQNYLRDWLRLRWGRIDDGVLAFDSGGGSAPPPVA